MNKKLEKTFQKIDKGFWKLVKHTKNAFQPKKPTPKAPPPELKAIEHQEPEVKPPTIEPLEIDINTDEDILMSPIDEIIDTKEPTDIKDTNTAHSLDDNKDNNERNRFGTPTFEFIVDENEFYEIMITESDKNPDLRQLINIIENWIMPELETFGFKSIFVPHPQFKGQYAYSDLQFNINDRWEKDWHNDKYCIFVVRLTEEHNVAYNMDMYVEHSKLTPKEQHDIYRTFQLYLPFNAYLYDYDPSFNKLEKNNNYLYLTYIKQEKKMEIPEYNKKYPSLIVICHHEKPETSLCASAIFTAYDKLLNLGETDCDMYQHTLNTTEFEIRYFNIYDVDEFTLKVKAELNNLHINDTIIKYNGLLCMTEDDIGTDFKSPDKQNNSYIQYLYSLAKTYTGGIGF